MQREGVNGWLAGSVVALSAGFFCTVVSIHNADREYFERLLVSSLERTLDPVITGAVKPVSDGTEPMPVPQVVRAHPLDPADFQIVALFHNEALLANRDELWRVRVGSNVPGLGDILEIDAAETGWTVRASKATLRTGR